MKQVSKNAIDLVILEWMLPDTPGNEVCQAIKRYYNDNFVPILMLTARSGLADRVAGLDAGADDFLTKPFHSDELMARVRSLLRIRKSELNRIRVIRELEIARDELREAILKEEANTVTVQFEFNDAVKVSCQQYLLYFVEFLRDIGIDATADLQEDAGQVLFSVTPKDKDEALDNIREALAIYLRLPMSRNTTVVVSPDTSIEVQKLSAQLHHFQGQLYLASAALQQKELTIQQQGTTIHYQQSLIEQQIASGQVLVQALQKEADDAEPVGGIVKVKAWSIDGIPIELDLPTLMRMLKERFKRRRFE